jgi:hypothetical protein
MTTYNSTTYSASTIATDLQLFFELHDHSYCNDPQFTERWGDYIKVLVCDRLWTYGEAVFDTELGLFEEEIDGVKQTLRDALAEFGRVCDGEDMKLWADGRWCDLAKCDECDKYVKSEDIIVKNQGDHFCEDCSPCSPCLEECEHCGDEVIEDELYQSSGGYFCEDCFNDRCCQGCCSEFEDEDDRFTSVDLKMTLCADCFKDNKANAEEEKRQYEERKKELEAKPRKTYKCRVECPADIDRTMKKMKLVLDEGAHFITTEIKAHPIDLGSGPITLPDREWTFTAIQDLKTIRTIFRLVEDLHVGLQTLQLEEDYTGERDYDLE